MSRYRPAPQYLPASAVAALLAVFSVWWGLQWPLALMPADPAHPKYEIYKENLRALELATDAKGRRLEVATIIDASEAEPTGEHFIRTYVNFYIANGGIVVPGYGVPSDATARETIQALFPGYQVVTVQVAKVAGAGGAIHCITQQQPAV